MSREYSKSCGRCNGCNTCNVQCDTCQKCDTCQAPCNAAQLSIEGSTCKVFRQFGIFDFSKCYSSGEIIGPGYFDEDAWQEIIDHYNTIGDKGITKPLLNPSSFLSDPSYSDLVPFSAAEFNRIADAVGANTVKPQDVIKGSYFSNLVNAINSLNGRSDSCDYCNSNCNCPSGDTTKCVACQTCVTCQGCVSCQGGDANCKNSCCGCDTQCESNQASTQ